MTIINGWFDFAKREPGPPGRRQAFDNTLEHITFHSMEANRGSSYHVFYDDVNRPGIAWHGTIGKDGILYQHYPITAGLYHGGGFANTRSPGFELEGFAGEPINPAQKEVVKKIIDNVSELMGVAYTRENLRIKEHGEQVFTACPSNRYDELWEEIHDMTKDEVEALIKEKISEGDLVSTTTVLSAIAQIVGAEKNTYSNTKKIGEIRQAIKELATPEPPKTTVSNVAKE